MLRSPSGAKLGAPGTLWRHLNAKMGLLRRFFASCAPLLGQLWLPRARPSYMRDPGDALLHIIP